MGEEITTHNRKVGKQAHQSNILAAKTLSDIIKTTLGPRGMDKMLIDGNGRITLTNDGVTILNEMNITHPAAQLIRDIAKTQEKEIGDGTTSVTILAGELLKNAEKLMEKGIHPTAIIQGYALAEQKAQEILRENSIVVEDDETLKRISMTAMTGKGAEGYREQLSMLIIDAIKTAQKEDIQFNGIIGRPIKETRLIKGVVLDKEIPENMPKAKQKVGEKLKIGLLDIDLDARQTEIDTNINFNSFEEYTKFQEGEDTHFKKFADKIIESGVDIVFCTKSINDKVLYYLGKKGIIAIRRVNKFDMDMLVKTTKAPLISNLEDFNEFGYAEKIYQEKYSDNDCRIFLEGCEGQGVTILVCATTEHLLQEIKRAMTDGLGDILASRGDYIVAGGGAIEIEISRGLIEYSKEFSGATQLAIVEFANVLESIPEILAENAGLNSINIITELRREHSKGNRFSGLNLFENKIMNTIDSGIIEPLKIKSLALSSSVECASSILRCDDLLQAKTD